MSKMHGYLVSFHRAIWNDKEERSWHVDFSCEIKSSGVHVQTELPVCTLANSCISETCPCCVQEHYTDRGTLPKAASKHFCGWETLRDRHLNCLCRQTLVLKCPKNRTERESDFNSIFHNSAKPKHIVKMSWIPRLWYIVVVKNCWVYYL